VTGSLILRYSSFFFEGAGSYPEVLRGHFVDDFNNVDAIFSFRLIAIRCEPQGEVHVSIAHSPRKDFFSGQLLKERKWENLGGPFKEVRWDKMEGKNFLNKIELLMASLTSSS
jgi:hypothetical protein